MDEINRTWFDRTLGIVPINTKAGRDTYKTPVTPQSQAPAQPVVQPWNATASAAASLPSCTVRAVRTAVRAAVRAARASHPGARSDARAVGKRRLRPGADAAHAGLRAGVRAGGHGAVLGRHWLDPVVELGLRCG